MSEASRQRGFVMTLQLSRRNSTLSLARCVPATAKTAKLPFAPMKPSVPCSASIGNWSACSRR